MPRMNSPQFGLPTIPAGSTKKLLGCGIVRLNARGGDLGAGPDRKRDLGLLAVVDREALEEQAAETRARAATAGVEDHEALEGVSS